MHMHMKMLEVSVSYLKTFLLETMRQLLYS